MNDYQKAALTTAVYPESMKVNYPTLGMCGEAGEVADKVKKVYRDKGGVFDEDTKKEIAKEIGDVLWYCAVLANDLGYSLEEVGQMNIDKLSSRKKRDMIHGNGDNR